MIKLKDLIRILPNPKEFYLCILDEHDNMKKHPKDMVYSRCNTYDFKTFNFFHNEDRQNYTQERINELLEYEVTGIDNYLWCGKFSNGDKITFGESLEPEEEKKEERLSHNLYVYIAPIEKKRKPKKETQIDLFEGITEDENI